MSQNTNTANGWLPETIVLLLHGAATGSKGWRELTAVLTAPGPRVFAPDMLGYGFSPPPSNAYNIQEEVTYLTRMLNRSEVDDFHLVAHSVGALYGLHLRRSLSRRVTRLTLVDPILVSVLREADEHAAYSEMEKQYQCFMSLCVDADAAAQAFVNHWSGAGTWNQMGERARAMVASLVPRLRLEIATRCDNSTLSWFSAAAPPTTILVGGNTLLPPRAVTRVLASAFGATTIVVPGAAHMIPLTHPKALARAVLTPSHRYEQARETSAHSGDV